MKLEFFDRFSKSNRLFNLTKFRLVGAKLFHSDGQTDGRIDMTKLIVAFRGFANAPMNSDYLRTQH